MRQPGDSAVWLIPTVILDPWRMTGVLYLPSLNTSANVQTVVRQDLRMKCTAMGKITFPPYRKLKLEKQVSFQSPLGPGVKLHSNEDGSLAVGMTLEAEESASAREKAAMELSRISSRLSYFYDVRIAQSETVGCSRWLTLICLLVLVRSSPTLRLLLSVIPSPAQQAHLIRAEVASTELVGVDANGKEKRRHQEGAIQQFWTTNHVDLGQEHTEELISRLRSGEDRTE